MNDDKLVTLTVFETGFEANLAKVTLETNGIKSIVLGEDLIANMPLIYGVRVELQVFARDVDKAKAILDTHEGQAHQECEENDGGGL
jgi:hypothetical protein